MNPDPCPATVHPLRLRAPHPPRPDLPLFVYLPGMDGTGTLFQPQIDALQPYFDIRCLVLPKNDRSDWPILAAQVVALLRRERGPQERPVFLCGESFGGCLALAAIRMAPELCDRLVLVNPATSFRARSVLKVVTTVLPWVSQGIYNAIAGAILPLLTGDRRVDPQEWEALKTAMQSVPPETAQWRLLLLEYFYLTSGQLQSVRCPTLLLAGTADRLLPSAAEAERLAALLPAAEILMLPGSGHACLLEAETSLLQILRSREFWLAGDRLPRSGKMR